ncbi:MAG: transcription antitermination factor NusB, partial [Gemmiger sp.]|nr:transcription antitermination factor NusB [Gemmiger sp.]
MTARYLAVQALMHQELNGYSNLVLDAALKKCTPPLSPRDAAFCTSIFYTALERQNVLDYALGTFTRKPVAKLDAPVRAILRAGLAQAVFLSVPLPAAVNESVKLAKAFGKTSAAGMVNAVLRRAAAFDVKNAKFATEEEKLSVLGNLSPQIAALLIRQYKEDAFALAEAFYHRPVTTIRVNTLKTTQEKLLLALTEEGCKAARAVPPWPDCLAVDFAASPAATAAFKAGWYHVQGLASQLAALCVGAKPG